LHHFSQQRFINESSRKRIIKNPDLICQDEIHKFKRFKTFKTFQRFNLAEGEKLVQKVPEVQRVQFGIAIGIDFLPSIAEILIGSFLRLPVIFYKY